MIVGHVQGHQTPRPLVEFGRERWLPGLSLRNRSQSELEQVGPRQ